jgi:hypothetical protein
MKYIKTFENYKVNESSDMTDVQLKVKQKIELEVKKLSEEDKNMAREELTKLASKLGLSPEDMTDATKVQAALSKKESDLKLESMLVNEGLREWWEKSKKGVYQWFTGLGLTGIIGGITSACIGGNLLSVATTAADYSGASVDPNTAAIVGGVAAAISALAMIIGLKGQGSFD